MYIILKTNYYRSRDGITTLATDCCYNTIEEAKEHLDSHHEADRFKKFDYFHPSANWKENNTKPVDFDGAFVRFQIIELKNYKQ